MARPKLRKYWRKYGDSKYDDLIIRWAIGRSSSNINRRMVRYKKEFRDGWESFFSDLIYPQVINAIKAGYKPRIQLHNPFGDDGAPMDSAGYVKAQAQGLDWLTEGYAKECSILREQGCEVISYIAVPSQDYLFRDQRQEPSGWWSLMHDSFREVIAAGSVAWDVGGEAKRNSTSYHVMALIRAMFDATGDGRKVYVEATPPLDKPHLHDYGMQIIETTYKKRHVGPRRSESYKRRFPKFVDGRFLEPTRGDEVYIGAEICRIIQIAKYHAKDGIPAKIEEIRADGHTAIINAWEIAQNWDAI